MKQYKTELHAHTAPVSPCAHMRAQEVAEAYLAAGYDSIVVTNHFGEYPLDQLTGSWEEKVDYYLSDYRAMKEYAGDRIHVILGCELRLADSMNDYLVIGMTEEFLYTHPELHRVSLAEFVPEAHAHGMLVVQAHPFRNGMMRADPALLDGVEVFNGHYRQQSRNQNALAWAEQNGLRRTSGSDFHSMDSRIGGGILTDAPVTDARQLAELIREGEYRLHCAGPTAVRDGMCDLH